MIATSKTKLTAVLAWSLGACVAVSASASAGDGYHPYENVTYSVVTISGGEISNGASEGNGGAYYAFNRDFSQDGWIGRIYGSVGRYDHEVHDWYDDISVDGDYWNGDLMFGYLWVRGGLDYSVLIGGEYQERKAVLVSTNFPALSGRERDDEFGFKVAADIESNGYDNSPIYLALGGSYSTAYETYYALGRVGYEFDRFAIGPEAWAIGDDSGDVQRLGGFMKLDFEMGTVASRVLVSGGYQFADEGFAGEFGEEGGYATIEFRMALGEHRAPLK